MGKTLFNPRCRSCWQPFLKAQRLPFRILHRLPQPPSFKQIKPSGTVVSHFLPKVQKEQHVVICGLWYVYWYRYVYWYVHGMLMVCLQLFCGIKLLGFQEGFFPPGPEPIHRSCGFLLPTCGHISVKKDVQRRLLCLHETISEKHHQFRRCW